MIFPNGPSDFSRLSKPSEEMGLGELSAHVDKIDKGGLRHPALQGGYALQDQRTVHLHDHGAIGHTPGPVPGKRAAFWPSGIVVGLMLSLIYWIGSGYVRSIFGYGGILPPVAAAWLPKRRVRPGRLWHDYLHQGNRKRRFKRTAMKFGEPKLFHKKFSGIWAVPGSGC